MQKLIGNILDIDINREDAGLVTFSEAILRVRVHTQSFNGIDPMKPITITQEDD